MKLTVKQVVFEIALQAILFVEIPFLKAIHLSGVGFFIYGLVALYCDFMPKWLAVLWLSGPIFSRVLTSLWLRGTLALSDKCGPGRREKLQARYQQYPFQGHPDQRHSGWGMSTVILTYLLMRRK